MSETTAPKVFGFKSDDEAGVIFVFDRSRHFTAALLQGKWTEETGKCVIGDFAMGYKRIPQGEAQLLAEQAWHDLRQD